MPKRIILNCCLVMLLFVYRQPFNLPAMTATEDSSPQSRQAEAKPELQVEAGHLKDIKAVAFSPDGRRGMSASSDQTVNLWDIESGVNIKQFSGGPAIAFSPDGRLAAIGGKGAHLRNLADGTVFQKLYEDENMYAEAMAFSPDGKLIAVMDGDTSVRIWDVKSGKISNAFVGSASRRIAFSANGQYLLAGGIDGNSRLFRISTGEITREFKPLTGEINSLFFSADGKSLLTCTTFDPATLWDFATGKVIRRFSIAASDSSAVRYRIAAMSPDGQAVFVTDKLKAQSFDVTTGKEITPLVELPAAAYAASFSPDGRYLLVGDYNGSVYLRDARTGRILREFTGYASNVYFTTLSPDGQRMLTASSVFDLSSGKEITRLGEVGQRASFTKDNKFALIVGGGTSATVWDAETGASLQQFSIGSDNISDAAISPDGEQVAASNSKATVVWDRKSRAELRRWESAGGAILRFSSDGTTLLVWDQGEGKLLNTKDWTQVRQFKGETRDVVAAEMSPDGRYVLTGSQGNDARLWDAQTGTQVAVLAGNFDNAWVTSVAFSPDGRTMLTAHNNVAVLRDTATRSEIRRFAGHTGRIRSMAFAMGGRFLVTTSEDATTRFWDLSSGQELCEMILLKSVYKITEQAIENLSRTRVAREFIDVMKNFVGLELVGGDRLWNLFRTRGIFYRMGPEIARELSVRDEGWVVVTPDSRFDTNNLDSVRGLHWLMPDDPMGPLPVEIFMRDYYEPKLLARVLSGEKFKLIRRLSELNRAQPDVKITNIERQKDNPEMVTVTVEVSKGSSGFKSGGGTVRRDTGVYDLRLFRDGQIVGQYPREANAISPAVQSNFAGNQELEGWRKRNRIELDAGAKRVIKFENIRLPLIANLKQTELSTYAFNEDRVKSTTYTRKFDIPADLVSKRGRAYLITVGVNAYDEPTFDLKYSSNDARSLQQILFDRLSARGEFEEIVQVPLISDYKMEGQARIITQNQATKNNFKAVLDLLAGRQIDAETKKRIPYADKLRQARPEDMVLISFSSHGYADNDGNFYFLLSDTGKSEGVRLSEGLLLKMRPRFLSSEELSLWLRDVDAGEMMMIVDACHSAAAVEGGEFKPGPMGSRGLGQLSYDKGMRILTATQAQSVAVGVGALKQGLLTYALVKDGIESNKADFKPADKRITALEWLQYGEYRVPKIYDEIIKGEAATDIRDLVQKQMTEIRRQQPSLFDFSRRRRDTLIVGLAQ